MKTAIAHSADFSLPLASIRVDPRANPRAESSYAGGSDEPGGEHASLDDLATSMKSIGQLQPCGVRQTKAGYDLVFGFRRYRAAQKAGLTHLRVTLAPDPTAALAENAPHKKLQAVEVMLECRRLQKTEKLTAAEIARRTTLRAHGVENYLRLSRLLHPRIVTAWQRSPGAFRVYDLLEVCMLSQEEQIAWLQKALGLPAEKDEAKKKARKKKRRLTIPALRKLIERDGWPELDRLTARAAALLVLEKLEERK